MSILIKGINPPKLCDDCPFAIFEWDEFGGSSSYAFCTATQEFIGRGYDKDIAKALLNKLPNCPIEPLPPNLIDVDKFKEDYHMDRKASCNHENEHRHFLTILNGLPPADRWISCADRLPEYGEAVLTINEDEDYEVNHIIDEDNSEWFYEGAIAWMPLPPYREG